MSKNDNGLAKTKKCQSEKDEILRRIFEYAEEKQTLYRKKMLSVRETCELTGLSRGSLYNLTYKHLIPFYRPNGKMIFFDAEDIEKWMRRNRIPSREEEEQNALNYVVTGRRTKGGAAQ